MIPLKSEKDLELMRVSGSILAKILQELRRSIKAGVTTAYIDTVAESLMQREKVKAAFKGYRGYPATICASVNEEIVHGIPGERVLAEGDVFSLDIGISYEGFFSDAAITVGVGKLSTRDKKLVEVTRQALAEGIKQAKVNNHLSDISNAVQNYVERYGFSVVRQFVGHGIGVQLHEEPEVANFGMPNRGPVLKHGMVLAIEPMVNTGTWESKILENGWTAVTADGLNSAHFEHTVAITNDGPEVLTR
ncbi:MAG TPA: type I methionyl aminopeptidase [Candidatus Omnitrophota bacterium]|nr:type I methionyl aminopeptidase [Candidatus Omnitrophota bacterium]HPT07548.1 type I methionyl aminopeptidase [Candidatus Omnitrophota bacterium]